MGPGAWIAGQGGVGPSGGPVASGSSLSGGSPVQGGAGMSATAAGGSASSSVAPLVPVVAAPSVAAAVRPGLPAPGLPARGSLVESGSTEVRPDIPVLQRECDLACGRFSVASVKIEHLRESLRAVEVVRGAAEEEVRAARDTALDAQAHAFGEFCS